jgi:hypothetical protein
MLTEAHVLYALIVACEVAFWLVLLLGLVLRYLVRWQGPSQWVLLSLPLIDVLLLIFTGLDLRAGTTPTIAHGLAAVYVGFTIAFGSIAVRWADAHFAYRFASGPVPPGAPSRGWKAVRLELGLWLRCVAAWVIALGLISAMIVFVGSESLAQPFEIWYRIALGGVLLWFLFGPVWALVFSSWRGEGAES